MNVGELRRLIEHIDDSTVIYTIGKLAIGRGKAIGVDTARLITATEARPVPVLFLETSIRYGVFDELTEPEP